MVRVGKEDLCFKYAVVTGKSLLLADHPPRDVREAARLSDVTSIRVVSGAPARSLTKRDPEDCIYIERKSRHDLAPRKD